jgi:hypothetical protein
MNEDIQSPPLIEASQNTPSQVVPASDQVNPLQPNNNFTKKRIIIYCVLLVIVLGFILSILLAGYITKSEVSKNSKTPTITITPTEVPVPTAEFVKNQLMVKYKTGMSPSEIDEEKKAVMNDLYKQLGVVVEQKAFESSSSALKNYYLLTFKTNLSLDEIATKLKTLPEIENVDKNFINRTN